ncbi:MAG: hypothetical protein WED34_20905 [Planctomycetales bacterium]
MRRQPSVEQGLEHNDFSPKKIEATVADLQQERDTVKDLLP